MRVHVPGVAWTALIIALVGALGGWLQTYVQEPWVPLVVLALSMLAKAAEIYLGQPATPGIQAEGRQPGKLYRWLFV